MIGWALAAQFAVVAHAPSTVTACAPFEITAAASAPGLVAPRVAAPGTPRLELLGTVATSRVDRDGAGRPLAVTEVTFRMATPAAGPLTLPGLRARLAGATARSAPIRLQVVPRAADDLDEPIVSVSARVDPDGVDPATPRYVGEQLRYVVDVHLNAAARHALRRNPTFFPPEMPSVLAYDLGAARPSRARAGAHCFERLTYQRALFPLFAGRTVIAPAVLAYALPVSPSYFSGEEPHELRTDSVSIEALEPPVAGRPAGYEGAVGSLRATARVDMSHGRMGDPIVLTERIEGAGNIKLLPRPALTLDWAAVVPASERVAVDSTHALVQGAKEFDWLITPRVAGRQTIALAPYFFFDPSRAAYDSTMPAPLALDVSVASLAAADTTIPRPRLAIRRVMRAERGAPLAERSVYWVLLALAPVPASLRRLWRARRPARRRDSALHRLARAGVKSAPPDAHDLRALFMGAVRECVGDPPGPAARGSLARHLGLAGVSASTARAADALVAQLDAAAYGGADLNARQATAEALRVAHAVRAEATVRPGTSPRRGLRAVGWLVLLASLVADAQVPRSRVADLFERGVHAYAADDLARARHSFSQVVSSVPRAVDGWANLGTTAWAMGDTAQASLAWQRALRLDPLDGDVRSRLDALPAPPSVGAAGYVLPLSADVVACIALALWAAGWLGLAVPRIENVRAARGRSAILIGLGVGLLGGALALQRQLDARQLAVVRHTVTLRTAPLASSMPSGTGTAASGEVARLGQRAGLWTRVSLDGARGGWLPGDALSPLDDDRAN